MALIDKLPWLKLSAGPPPPRSATQQWVHFILSLLLLAVSLGVVWMVVMSETRRTFSCDGQRCVVMERNGLFAKSLKVVSGKKPVTLETRERQIGGLSVLMIDADGESDWITAPNSPPDQVRKVAADLNAYREGESVVLDRDGFGIEWYILSVLLLSSCVLNLRKSLLGFFQ